MTNTTDTLSPPGRSSCPTHGMYQMFLQADTKFITLKGLHARSGCVSRSLRIPAGSFRAEWEVGRQCAQPARLHLRLWEKVWGILARVSCFVADTLSRCRICPGRYLALDSLFIIVASLLHVFDVSAAVDENEIPIRIEHRQSDGLLSYVPSRFLFVTTTVR